MGLKDFFSGPKKEKASQNEKFLKEVGTAQIGASKMFEAAHQAMLKAASGDQSGIIRGRAAGQVWQGLGGEMGANRIARGDVRKQGVFENLAGQAVGTALRSGATSGLKLQDEAVHMGATARLSNAQSSGATARSEARDVAREASQKVQLANQWNQDLQGAAATFAMAGGQEYMAGRAAGNKAELQNMSALSDGPAAPPNENWFYNLGYKRGVRPG